MKRLSDYASALGSITSEGANPLIEDVTNNSKSPGRNSLFCAIPGAKRDGHDFIAEAAAKGAVAAVASRVQAGLPEGFPLLLVEDPHLAWALACETRFDRPAESLSLAGVTGTNGKTTIAFLLRKLLEAAQGVRCGLVSTVLYDDCGGGAEVADRTTPDAYELQSLFARMRANGCTHAVMEASSHGLHQKRTGSAKFEAAIFTNLTGDHLDYHRDMESYYLAKKLLFSDCLAKGGTAAINLDDPYGARLQKEISKAFPGTRALGYAKSAEAFCGISTLSLSDAGAEIELKFQGLGSMRFKSSLIGEHNAYNIAAAATAALSLGVAFESVRETLAKPFSVPGRLEPFAMPSGATAFVDYAHTDDALFRALSALRPLCKGSLTTVFGCGGDRDASKRPRMGSVSSRLSDLIVITSDNPRSEDPLEIIAQIRKGVQSGAKALEEPDRLEAIRKAVELSARGDVILIAGKGHEAYQEAKGRKIHFDDREVLASLGGKPV